MNKITLNTYQFLIVKSLIVSVLVCLIVFQECDYFLFVELFIISAVSIFLFEYFVLKTLNLKNENKENFHSYINCDKCNGFDSINNGNNITRQIRECVCTNKIIVNPHNNYDNNKYIKSTNQILSMHKNIEHFMDDPVAIDYYRNHKFPSDNINFKNSELEHPNLKKDNKESFVSFEDRYRGCNGENCNRKKVRVLKEYNKKGNSWCGCGDNCRNLSDCPKNIKTNAKSVNGSMGMGHNNFWQIGNLHPNLSGEYNGFNQSNTGSPYCGKKWIEKCNVIQDPIINNPLEPVCTDNDMRCDLNKIPDNYGYLIDRIEKPLKYTECESQIIVSKQNPKIIQPYKNKVYQNFVKPYKQLNCAFNKNINNIS